MPDIVKAFVTMYDLEKISYAIIGEKRRQLELEENDLKQLVEETKDNICRNQGAEIEWQEIRIENSTKAKWKDNYTYKVYWAWEGVSMANDEPFNVIFIPETQNAMIHYLQYKGEMYFLHRSAKTWGLPYITEDSIDLAIRLKVLVKINERYKDLLQDIIARPNVYAKKMGTHFEVTKYDYKNIAEALLEKLYE